MMQDRVAWDSEWQQSKPAQQVEHNLELIGCDIVTIVRLPKAQEREKRFIYRSSWKIHKKQNSE